METWQQTVRSVSAYPPILASLVLIMVLWQPSFGITDPHYELTPMQPFVLFGWLTWCVLTLVWLRLMHGAGTMEEWSKVRLAIHLLMFFLVVPAGPAIVSLWVMGVDTHDFLNKVAISCIFAGLGYMFTSLVTTTWLVVPLEKWRVFFRDW